MEPSGTGDSSTPLADITNNKNQGVLDRNERRRQRYASVSKEQKDELNRKKRERRVENKRRTHENTTRDGGVPMDQDENNEWLHKGQLTQTNDRPGVRVTMQEDEEWLHRVELTQNNDLSGGCEISISAEMNDDCIHHRSIESTIGEGGGEVLSNSSDTNGDGIYDSCIDTNVEGGAVDETTPVVDQNLSPSECRRRKSRARYAAMSPLQKETLNKRRRDARAAKRLFKTPDETNETRKKSKLNYKQKIKEHRANNLHPDSIVMANPQFKPELLFPPGDKPPSKISEEMEIPDFGGTPVYVEAAVQEPPQQIETPETFLSNTIHTAHLTPGLRQSRRKRRNQEFESTIGRNTNGTTCENENIASQPTQSCVVTTGVTQTYPRGDGTSGLAGAGTPGHASRNERCTQTQPSVVDEPDSMPPHDLHRHPCQAGDENIIFDEDEEVDEGFLFAGQEDAADDVVDIDLPTGDEDNIEPDAPDPFGAVYGNVPEDGHTLKPVDNCEFYNAKKFEYEPSGFCCRSGAIHLSTPDTPPDELVRLWTASDADARHFRDHIRYFNGHFSFTSLHCSIDSVTTDTR